MAIRQTLGNTDKQKWGAVTVTLSLWTRRHCLKFGVGKIGTNQKLKLENKCELILLGLAIFFHLELLCIICLEQASKQTNKLILE